MGGHLASLHNNGDISALQAATEISGVTNTVLVGGFEPTLSGSGAKGPWEWTGP